MIADYVEKKSASEVKHYNAHSLCIIDHQAMKIIRKPLDVIFKVIAERMKERKLLDTDILYMVPTGKEYHTIPTRRIKNDKFTACIRNGEEIIRKRGSIRPLVNWLAEHVSEDSKVFISRHPVSVGE